MCERVCSDGFIMKSIARILADEHHLIAKANLALQPPGKGGGQKRGNCEVAWNCTCETGLFQGARRVARGAGPPGGRPARR